MPSINAYDNIPLGRQIAAKTMRNFLWKGYFNVACYLKVLCVVHMVVYVCNTTLKTKAGGLRIWGQTELPASLSRKQANNNDNNRPNNTPTWRQNKTTFQATLELQIRRKQEWDRLGTQPDRQAVNNPCAFFRSEDNYSVCVLGVGDGM